LRVIAGLEVPDAGEIVISGEDATALAPQKRGVGFVFQHYAAFKHMTVRNNIAFGLKIRKRPKAEIAERVDRLLELVQLQQFGHRYPAQLSGGQRQRMARARSPSSPRCCCSTSRSARSTHACGPSSASGCAASTRRCTSRPSSSPTIR